MKTPSCITLQEGATIPHGAPPCLSQVLSAFPVGQVFRLCFIARLAFPAIQPVAS